MILKIAIMTDRVSGRRYIFPDYGKASIKFNDSKQWVKGHKNYPKWSAKRGLNHGKWEREEIKIHLPGLDY